MNKYKFTGYAHISESISNGWLLPCKELADLKSPQFSELPYLWVGIVSKIFFYDDLREYNGRKITLYFDGEVSHQKSGFNTTHIQIETLQNYKICE